MAPTVTTRERGDVGVVSPNRPARHDAADADTCVYLSATPEWACSVDELDATAFARGRTPADQPGSALRAQKRLIDATLDGDFDAALAPEKAPILALFDGPEFAALHQGH